MHYLPDTNDEDAVQERYWPDSYKLVIRQEMRRTGMPQFNEEALVRIYKTRYKESFPNIKGFLDLVVNGIIIGAENGADDGFESVYASFIAECALPEIFLYAHGLWPDALKSEHESRIHRAIVRDFEVDDGFKYAYSDGYAKRHDSFEDFIDRVADIIVADMKNGIYTTLERYYKAFFYGYPLPPMRRNPRRLKTW